MRRVLLVMILVMVGCTPLFGRECDKKTKIKVRIWQDNVVMCCDQYKIFKGGKLWCRDVWEVPEEDWKRIEVNEAYPPYKILPIKGDD